MQVFQVITAHIGPKRAIDGGFCSVEIANRVCGGFPSSLEAQQPDIHDSEERTDSIDKDTWHFKAATVEFEPCEKEQEGHNPKQIAEDVEQEIDYPHIAMAERLESAKEKKRTEQDGNEIGAGQGQQPFGKIRHVGDCFMGWGVGFSEIPKRKTGNCYRKGRGLSLAHIIGKGVRLLVLRISGKGFARD